MPVEIDGVTYYRTAEVFRMIKVSRNTLYRWLAKGALGDIEYRDSRGWRLFTIKDVETLKNQLNRVIKVNRVTK